MSDVFNEARDASTLAKAYDVIFLGGNGGDERQKLDRQLLVNWLNFANGGIEWGEMIDTDNNGSLDTAFADVMANAEAVRLNPASTEAQLRAQRQLLQKIHGEGA